MLKRHTTRLALLAQGAALIGLGMTAACQKNEAAVNGPAPEAAHVQLAASASVTPAAGPEADAGPALAPTVSAPQHLNSPKTPRPVDSSPKTPALEVPADAGSAIRRPIMNAPPKAYPKSE